MATLSDIKQAVYDTTADAVSALTGADADSRVGLDMDPSQEQLPAVAFEVFDSPRAVSGGHTVVAVNATEVDGEITAIEYEEPMSARVDFTVHADSAGAVDEWYEQLREQFVAYESFKEPTDLHTDVETVDTRSGSPAPRSPYVRGTDLTVEIGYSRYQTYSDFEPIRSVDFTGTSDLSDPDYEFSFQIDN